MISTDAIDRYRIAAGQPSGPNLAWNVYGTGIEAVGHDGLPEIVEMPSPGPDQLLVRVDAVGLCFSDVKLIRQGGDHPKLYGQDLAKHPTRLGHEVTVTVIEAGQRLQNQYPPGLRLAIQPDIYIEGRSTAYGYTIPGGLIRYHLIGSEILDADDGAYVIPVSGRGGSPANDASLGYAAVALSEPWACVEAAYTQRRRLSPLSGGTMWIVGNPTDPARYEFSRGIAEPDLIILTNVPPGVASLVDESRKPSARVEVRDTDDYPALSQEMTGGAGFDDIVVLDPRSAAQMAAIANNIAFRGTKRIWSDPNPSTARSASISDGFTITTRLTSATPDPISPPHTARTETAASCSRRAWLCSWGQEARWARCTFSGRWSLTTVRRPLPRADQDRDRLSILMERLAPLAAGKGRQLLAVDSSSAPGRALWADVVSQATGGRGADDVIVTVPVATVMARPRP